MSRQNLQIEIKEKKEGQMELGELYKSLGTSYTGISSIEAKKRITRYGYNQAVSKHEKLAIVEFFKRFLNPLTITLLLVATLSFILGQNIDASIVITMAVLSVALSYIQEYNASKTAKKLRAMINIKATVWRDGKKHELAVKELVPGDIIELSAGKMIPADVRIISSNHFSVNQAVLTGESFPVDKNEKLSQKSYTSVFDMENIAFMGSSVAGGSATAVVISTGKQTEFGKLSLSLVAVRTQATAFDKGIRSFTYLMIRLITVLVLVIFVANVALKGNSLEGLLFALAVAVGLTPEMLPMILTINLSKGAMAMAKKKVIVKELASIQNFGAMDILCTDKTGTLTEDKVSLQDHIDSEGKDSARVLELAYKNSMFQTGMDNVLDNSIKRHKRFNLEKITKIYEIPFDFNRRIMSVIIKDKTIQLIAKGAPENILHKSTHLYSGGKIVKLSDEKRIKLHKKYDKLSQEGYRVLAIAYKNIKSKKTYSLADEKDLVFAGYVTFIDTAKASSKEAMDKLESLGINIKILTGDNEYVTRNICREIGLEITGLVTSQEINSMNDAQLRVVAMKANIFTRLTPDNKVRIIKILKSLGHTVGYMGDGINDSPSLKAADVGISVNNAADISKETAEIILLEKNLNILANCVTEGRKVFGNTVKYIKMGASSNFGNMFSMAGASLFLPFMPMLPPQILLNNFLYDISQVALPTDNVDKEYIEKPKPWNINFLKEFIFIIGPISSIFDFATFGIMIWVFNASPSLFQTGWFVESLTTQILVIHIIRTNKVPFIGSRASKSLLLATIGTVLVGALIPYTFIGGFFGFTPLPPLFFGILLAMSVAYLILVQFVKTLFARRFAE
jgi:Mg2+-importing ATPase